MCAYGICLYTIYEMIDSNDTRHGKGNLGLFCYSKVITLLHSEHQDSKYTHRKQSVRDDKENYRVINVEEYVKNDDRLNENGGY